MAETMAKLKILRGLPASGKSTYARKLVQSGWIRVNRDDLRITLFAGEYKHKKGHERFVVQAEKDIVLSFLNSGKNVIVDDTNLSQKHIDMWKGVARRAKGEVNVETHNMHGQDFTLDDIQDLIKRDADRAKSVGAGVIWNMAFSNGYLDKHYGDNPVLLCDIDGTIADVHKARLGFVKNGNSDWHSFFEMVGRDEPRLDVIAQVSQYVKDTGARVIFVTARPEFSKKGMHKTDIRSLTASWLNKHLDYGAKFSLPYPYPLIMRQGNDFRRDDIVKGEMYTRYFKNLNVVKVFDDRPQVIRKWRELGLDVEDVGRGLEF